MDNEGKEVVERLIRIETLCPLCQAKLAAHEALLHGDGDDHKGLKTRVQVLEDFHMRIVWIVGAIASLIGAAVAGLAQFFRR